MPTEQLRRLLTSGTELPNFKQSAMALVRQGADITVRSDHGTKETLLHVLARSNEAGANNNEITELVGLNRAVLASQDKYGCTALQSLIAAFTYGECSFANFKPSAMALARAGADITLASTAGAHPCLLHVLALNNEGGVNNDEIAELARLNPAVLASTDYYDRTALQSLIDAFTDRECSFANFKLSAMALAKAGADITLASTAGALLHVFALNNEGGVNNNDIDELVALNPAVLASTDYSGRTPVHLLLSSDHTVTKESIERLLSATNLALVDDNNETLLHVACRSGNLPMSEYLFSRGVSLTAVTKRQETLIHYAVLSRNTDLIRWLIDTRQIDINARDQFGQTALHKAARQNNRDIVDLLVSNKADYAILDDRGQSASDLAIQMQFYDLLPSLVNPRAELFQTIEAMHNYGVVLRGKGVSKGQVSIDLAADLTAMANDFFEQEPLARNFDEFQPRFLTLLHSKDPEMCEYRIAWGTIVKNIAIALTGIGLLLIAGKLLYSKATEGRALFFFQKPKTTSEEKIAHTDGWVDHIAATPQLIRIQ